MKSKKLVFWLPMTVILLSVLTLLLLDSPQLQSLFNSPLDWMIALVEMAYLVALFSYAYETKIFGKISLYLLIVLIPIVLLLPTFYDMYELWPYMSGAHVFFKSIFAILVSVGLTFVLNTLIKRDTH